MKFNINNNRTPFHFERGFDTLNTNDLKYLSMKMDKRFIFVLLSFWLVVGLLMFINGLLRYGHWEVAAIRNVYLTTIGAILSIPFSFMINYFRKQSIYKLLLSTVFFAIIASILLGGFLNPLTFSLLGVEPVHFTVSAMTNQIVIYFILFCIWSWLYYSGFGLKQKEDYTANELVEKNKPYFFEILDKGQLIKVSTDLILSITANGDYVNIHTENRDYLFTGRMKNLAHALETYGFKRIHRSTLVNKNHIKSVTKLGKGRYKIYLLDGKEYESSKNWESNIQALIPIKN